MLMRFYLGEHFHPEQLQWVADIPQGRYYTDMAAAWYFATALITQYDAVIDLLERRGLDPWVHNKTIQKALESYRISPEQKTYLRSLKSRRATDDLP